MSKMASPRPSKKKAVEMSLDRNSSHHRNSDHLQNSDILRNSNHLSLPLTRQPSPPSYSKLDDFKKRKSGLSVALQRWKMKFNFLHRSIQIGIFILALGSMYVLFQRQQQQLNIQMTSTTAKAGSSVRNIQAEPAEMAKMKHRPHGIPGNKRRIIQLIDSDVTRAEENEIDSRTPPPGQYTLIERYNPLPHEVPPLKAASTLDKGNCQAIADWQLQHNPTCNVVHEMTWGWDHIYSDIDDIDRKIPDEGETPFEQTRLAAGGAFRHVWMVRDFDGTKRALKTLRASKSKEFDLRNFDRHRRDAVSMERLTSSPLVVDIYGYCANSALFDWGEGGDLLSIFQREPDISKEKLLHIAYNVSLSISHAHNFDELGRPTIAHTDIKPDQFLYQDGYYRLTDFNRVRFLMWNKQKNLQCGFTVGKNGGIWRAPEEYNYEIETEKVDVYSLGNVLYYLLTRELPWKDLPTKEIYELVKHGKRPKIPKYLQESDHPFHKYMIEAIQMAYTHNFLERPSAYEIAQKLKEGFEESN